jgi:hypothetical protein
LYVNQSDAVVQNFVDRHCLSESLARSDASSQKYFNRMTERKTKVSKKNNFIFLEAGFAS